MVVGMMGVAVLHSLLHFVCSEGLSFEAEILVVENVGVAAHGVACVQRGLFF